MPHVTFIHGIANKPPPDELIGIWKRALETACNPLPLGTLGVTSSMVYWADLMYAEPEPDTTAFEGTLENTPAAIDGAGDATPPKARTSEEEAFLDSLREKMTGLSEEEIESGAAPEAAPQAEGQLERVPLPWPIKKLFLNAFLRDVHHYLFDVTYAPPGKQPVAIQQTIRRRFVDALSAADVTRPHVVVSHSMGTVIAYDCLKRVAACPAVDALITLGSPLGLDEIQDKLQPGWARADGFPHERAKEWVNQSDRLDPVCGFAPLLAADFLRNGVGAVEDAVVSNDGRWRHSIVKYLRQPSFTKVLRRMLDV
jgi:hypothetical protein